ARPGLHGRVAAREAVAAHAVGRGVERLGVGRVHRQVDEPGVRVDELDEVPGLAAVAGPVHAALRVRPPEVAEGGDVDDVRVPRVDDDAADVVRFLEAHVPPGLAAVGGPVHALAPRDAVARVGLAGADPDDVRVGRGHGDVADGGRALVLEDRSPA